MKRLLPQHEDGTCTKLLSGEECVFSPYPSEPASNTAQCKEAVWVDNNRHRLTQSVCLVMPIADCLLQKGIIHKEKYNQIKAEKTSQDQMREVYSALTYAKAKYEFYRVLQELEPQIIETEDITREVIKKNKDYLKKRCTWEFEGTVQDQEEVKSLEEIYTTLHIIQGESENVNQQHEIWELDERSKNLTAEGKTIDCNDIFAEDTTLPGQGRRPKIRTVMTKGIAGIGKTVSVKKFILDWANGTANPSLDFIFMFPFRELNLITDDEFSLETLVTEFHQELKDKGAAKFFDTHRVLFIFDGLDESQLKLNFKSTKRLTDPRKVTSVDTIVTNLIREHLLPSALVWITSRPGAIQRIPRKHVHQWTEVRGFNDPQKTQYFRNRVRDKVVAQRIIRHIKTSRSLYIMCHIPIFCWIASKVFEDLLSKMGSAEGESRKTPTTLTEMYTHFLSIQMRVAAEKYGNEDGFEDDIEEIFRSNEEFVLKLGRLAFEKLDKGEIIFSGKDLEKYGIDIDKAGVYCGFCTAILKEEDMFNKKKLYCFVHLTLQEYFAALFVYCSFARKKIDSLSLRDFLLTGSDQYLKGILEEDPVDLPLNDLMEITIANSALRTTGELDMFLRFLIGMSLQSTQERLQGLIQQTDEHKEVVEEIIASLKDIDLDACSPERCLNLVHCLVELKDSSIKSVQKYVRSDHGPETQLSPIECSALAVFILTSDTPLEEFDLRKYRPPTKGVFRLLPAVRNCRKVRISGVFFNSWTAETLASALKMRNSVLSELQLTNGDFSEQSIDILADALNKAECKLEALSLSGNGLGYLLEKVVVIDSPIPNLKDLELSEVGAGWIQYVIDEGLINSKMERLRLNRNSGIRQICQVLATALSSKLSNLRELDLNHTSFGDSEMEFISTALMSNQCTLEALSLRNNKLTGKGCETLASALIVRKRALRELDLSYNDLHDSGLIALCDALRSPHCSLRRLRLLFCKVTVDGCTPLGSALRSDHCSLRELDLSFNHLTHQGVKLLTEVQRDSRCSLEHLLVEQSKECWVNLKLLRHHACDLTLDPNTAGAYLTLTQENKLATCNEEVQQHPDDPDRFEKYQVMCREGLTGCHYWEVEYVSRDVGVGVAYKSMPRSGDCTPDFSLGGNEKSWCWNTNNQFCHNCCCQRFNQLEVKRTGVLGVYLDWPAGILSFFEVYPYSNIHLYTEQTTFSEPLHPAFSLLPDGSVHLKTKDKSEVK